MGGGEREFCLAVSCPPPPLSQRSSLPRRETPGRRWGGGALVQVQVRGAFLDLVLPPSDQMAHSVHVAKDGEGGWGCHRTREVPAL